MWGEVKGIGIIVSMTQNRDPIEKTAAECAAGKVLKAELRLCDQPVFWKRNLRHAVESSSNGNSPEKLSYQCYS